MNDDGAYFFIISNLNSQGLALKLTQYATSLITLYKTGIWIQKLEEDQSPNRSVI